MHEIDADCLSALLAQSLLLIIAHLFLLSLCLHYAPFSHFEPEATYAQLSPPSSPHLNASNDSNAKKNPRRSQDDDDDLDRDLGLNSDGREGEAELELAPEGGSYVDEPLHHSSASNRPSHGVNTGAQSKTAQKAFSSSSLPGGSRGSWKDGSRRPFDFWQWEGMGTYLEFLAGLVVVLGVLQVVLGRWGW